MAIHASSPPLGLDETWWDSFDPPPGHRAEVIGGDLVLTPSPGLPHAFAATNLFRMLDAFVPDGLIVVQTLAAVIEWRLAEGGVVAAAPIPDLIVVSESISELTDPPMLAVEILSRSDHARLPSGLTYIEGKRLDYATHGLQDYLEVEGDLEGTVSVTRYELHDGMLKVAHSVTGNQVMRSDRPLPYEIRPAGL